MIAACTAVSQEIGPERLLRESVRGDCCAQPFQLVHPIPPCVLPTSHDRAAAGGVDPLAAGGA